MRPSPVPPTLPALSARQRLIAAEQLAAGDEEVLAATAAGCTEEEVRQLLAGDPAFDRLVAACRRVQGLPRRDWQDRVERLLRGATERAIHDGRVTTINMAARATGALELDDEPDPMAEEVEEGPLAGMTAEMLRQMSREDVINYMMYGEAEREGGDGLFDSEARPRFTLVRLPPDAPPVESALDGLRDDPDGAPILDRPPAPLRPAPALKLLRGPAEPEEADWRPSPERHASRRPLGP
jgi:hypothetical protein